MRRVISCCTLNSTRASGESVEKWFSMSCFFSRLSFSSSICVWRASNSSLCCRDCVCSWASSSLNTDKHAILWYKCVHTSLSQLAHKTFLKSEKNEYMPNGPLMIEKHTEASIQKDRGGNQRKLKHNLATCFRPWYARPSSPSSFKKPQSCALLASE